MVPLPYSRPGHDCARAVLRSRDGTTSMMAVRRRLVTALHHRAAFHRVRHSRPPSPQIQRNVIASSSMAAGAGTVIRNPITNNGTSRTTTDRSTSGQFPSTVCISHLRSRRAPSLPAATQPLPGSGSGIPTRRQFRSIVQSTLPALSIAATDRFINVVPSGPSCIPFSELVPSWRIRSA